MKKCVAIILATPLFASAQEITVEYLFARTSQILMQILGLLIGVAFLVFVWGIIQYVIAQSDEKKLQEGKKIMLYGLIGLVAITATWAFVSLLIFTIFGQTPQNPFDFSIPQLQQSATTPP